MIKNKQNIIIIIVVILSFFIRIYQAGNYPPLLWDEAALGYNAYSISNTGKDEYNQITPLILKSFGDYKPALYTYLAIPFIKIFGLNEIAVRLPSIILGSLLPLFLYFLIKEINPKSHKIALISAIVLAFNPYNIHFSRGAWETNILTIELVIAALFFFKFINFQKSKHLFFSALFFGLTLFTYQAGKMISLFLIIILFLINFKKLNLKNLQIYKFFILPLFIFSLPIIYGLLFSSNANRLKIVSLFSYPRSTTETQQIISETNPSDYQLFHNHTVFFTRNFLLRYFNHFSPRFLAFEGDWQNPRHSAPYIGVVLYPSLIFLVIGLSYFISRKKIEKINLFFLFWLIITPILSALTRDSIQAVRSMSFSIPLVYFISTGIYFFLNKFKNIFLCSVLFAIYLISFIYYSDLYFNHMVKKSPNDFLYGYKEAMEFTIKNKNKYNQIVFTDFYGQPYIYYLFYSQYPPQNYQKQANLVTNEAGDAGKIINIDNINFTSTDWQYIKNNPHTLGIFSRDEILRQGIDKSPDFNKFIPLSPINGISTFYAYENI